MKAKDRTHKHRSLAARGLSAPLFSHQEVWFQTSSKQVAHPLVQQNKARNNVEGKRKGKLTPILRGSVNLLYAMLLTNSGKHLRWEMAAEGCDSLDLSCTVYETQFMNACVEMRCSGNGA